MTEDQIDAKVIQMRNCLVILADFGVITPNQRKSITTKIGAWGYDRTTEFNEEAKL